MTVGLENLPQVRCGEGAVMATSALCSTWLAAPLRSVVRRGDMRLLQREPRHASLRELPMQFVISSSRRKVKYSRACLVNPCSMGMVKSERTA